MTSVARRTHDSGDYSDASQENDRNTTGDEVGHPDPESDYDSRGSESDLSERDPENQQEGERRVDDDEDRSNPQYIPKRGTFYEHDDRTASGGEETTNAETSETPTDEIRRKEGGSEGGSERRRPPRKSDVVDKWSHDKFNEREQMPKTREELVTIYGYDIRNEDAPPHARRNRRYGRGPNKYTRTWEDEEAYRRQQVTAAPRKVPGQEDFPDLQAPGYQNKKRPPRQRSKSQPPSNESSERGSSLRRNASTKSPKNKESKPGLKNSRPVKPAAAPKARRDDSLPNVENLTITANVANSNSSPVPGRRVSAPPVAQLRPVPTAARRTQAPQPPVHRPPQPPAPAPPPAARPPARQDAPPQNGSLEGRGGSKRYSSLRQRPLQENYTPQQQQQQQQQPPQQQRYHNEYPGNAPPHAGNNPQMLPQQQIIHQQMQRGAANQAHGPSPPHAPINQQVRIGMMEPQPLGPHGHHAMHALPQTHSIGQMPPQPQGYAPPAMMPAQFMQGGGAGVFPGGALFPAPYTHAHPHPPPMYQHHNYVSQAGGVTYYAAPEEPAPRPARRPTAAIPIVRPKNERPVNSAEKDIDRIVENMFVRKPWPAQGEFKDKPQSETRNSAESNSKESSQPESLTSSSISTESRPSAERSDPNPERPEETSQSVPQPQNLPSTQNVPSVQNLPQTTPQVPVEALNAPEPQIAAEPQIVPEPQNVPEQPKAPEVVESAKEESASQDA